VPYLLRLIIENHIIPTSISLFSSQLQTQLHLTYLHQTRHALMIFKNKGSLPHKQESLTDPMALDSTGTKPNLTIILSGSCEYRIADTDLMNYKEHFFFPLDGPMHQGHRQPPPAHPPSPDSTSPNYFSSTIINSRQKPAGTGQTCNPPNPH